MNGRILIIAAITASVSLNNLFSMVSLPAAERPITQFGALAVQRAAATTLPRFYSTGPSSSEAQTPPVEPSSFDNQIRRGRAGTTSRSFVPSSSLRPSISSRLQSPFFNQPSRGFASFKAEYSYDPKKLGTALDNLSALLNKHFKTNAIKLSKNSTWRDILHMSQAETNPSAENPKKNILQKIKLRYYELAKIVHTDQNKTPEAATQFVVLQEAHENGAESAEKNTEISMSFNPPSSRYTSQSSSSSQSQQRSWANQAKNDWQTQQDQKRAAYEQAAREAAEEARREREERARQQQQGSWQSYQSQSQSQYESEQEFLRRQKWEEIKQIWHKLNPFQKVVVGSLAGLVITAKFALAHKKKIAAVTLAYYAYKNYSEGKAKESAKKLYEQNKSTMDQLGFDEYWHTHEITDKALVDIARKNFAKAFINTYLSGEYNGENVEKFQREYSIKINQLDEKWMKDNLWWVNARYNPIINQLDALQKARDKMFNRTTTVSLKDQLTPNIYKEIADGLQSYRRWRWVPGYNK
jgi:uncharacterized membrane protein